MDLVFETEVDTVSDSLRILSGNTLALGYIGTFQVVPTCN